MSKNRAAISIYPPIDFQLIKPYLFSLLVFCAIMALNIRGLFEVTIGKALAYIVQLLLWTLAQFFAVTMFRYRVTSFLTIGIMMTLLFGIVAVISSIWTMNVNGSPFGLISTMVNVYLLFLFVVGYGFQTEAFSAKPVVLSMALAGILLPVVGVVQLFGKLELPGNSMLRPPSVTGSYLHFPLLCGVLGICLMQAAVSLRWWFLALISLLCLVGIAISGGRSGTLVFLGTGALYILFEFLRIPSSKRWKFTLIALAAIAVFGVAVAIGYQFSNSLQHIAQLWDLQDTGNSVRIVIWRGIYTYWSNTNLWFGEYTGIIGNTANNLAGGIGLVAESGALQQLINFGALGFLLFYAVMLLTYFAIANEMTFLRALFISAIIQTAFYQSTEVLPYMAMLAFLPTFSRSLQVESAARHSNQGR